jgi:hypothetical protein
MKLYAAVIMCAIVAPLSLAFAGYELFLGNYKTALAGLIVALAAGALGWQEWADARLVAKLMQRPPFTTTDHAPEALNEGSKQ